MVRELILILCLSSELYLMSFVTLTISKIGCMDRVLGGAYLALLVTTFSLAVMHRAFASLRVYVELSTRYSCWAIRVSHWVKKNKNRSII
jgi:hypothetical protein